MFARLLVLIGTLLTSTACADESAEPKRSVDQIHYRCQFVELTAAAAVEFAAAAKPADPATQTKQDGIPGVAVYTNADEVIRRMREAGKVKRLGAPEIVGPVDEPAKYRAGGEFPIPVPQGDGKMGVEWRPFGVSCTIKAELLESGRVRLDFAPEVAERDFRNAVEVDGVLIPGLRTRRINVRAELAFGETLVGGGGMTSTDSRMPGEKLTTLFLVTPTRVKPAGM